MAKTNININNEAYRELMRQSDRAMCNAIKYYHKEDAKMMIFWRNASEDFKNRALELEVSNAVE